MSRGPARTTFGLLPVGLLVAAVCASGGAWAVGRSDDGGGPRELMQVTARAEKAPVSTAVPAPTAPQAIPESSPTGPAAVILNETPALPVTTDTRQTFDGRPIEPVRTIRMSVTAYSPDMRSCGAWANGQTASGYSVWTNGMKLVAADTTLLPFDTIVTVPGYHDGRPVQVLDRGGRIKGRRLDVLFPTHQVAREWGRQDLEVTVWRYADGG